VGRLLPKKILVVRLGAIGDVVNALVFATALKRAEPSVEIGWAVHALSLPLIEAHPMIDRVHLWRRERGVRGFLALLRDVRRERYDMAIDLQRIFKSGALARLSGARRVLGYDKARAKEASWIWSNERIPAGDPGAHMVEQYLEVARHLGIEAPQPEHLLPEDEDASNWAEHLVSELGGSPVVINVGASKPANRWVPERFGEVARACLDRHGLPVCLTGGPDDVRSALVAAETAGPDERLRNLVGLTDLRQLAALESRAALFVGCDTGPMHLAVACGAPVVALFGPADPRRTGPFGDRNRVVLAGTGDVQARRMEQLSVESVLDAVEQMVGAPTPRAPLPKP